MSPFAKEDDRPDGRDDERDAARREAARRDAAARQEGDAMGADEVDELRETLARAFDVDRPSPIFEARLGALLRQEHTALFEGARQDEQPAEVIAGRISARNGHSDGHGNGAAAAHPASNGAGRLSANSKNPRAKTIRFPRALKWGVAAACLVLATGWWMSSPSYTWASMIAALGEREWIEVEVEFVSAANAPKNSAKGWLSGARNVLAIVQDDDVQFDDHRAGERLRRRAGEAVVGRRPLKEDATATAERRFLELVLNTLARDGKWQGDPDAKFAVREESWRRSPDGTIELRVRLAVETPPQGEIRLLLHLNPQTKLPTRAKVESSPADGASADSASAEGGELEFNYPQSGPQDIYTLGVSRDTPIVDGDEADRLAGETLARLKAATSTPQVASIEPSRPPIAETPTAPVVKELPPPRSVDEMRARVDELLRAHWKANSVTPVATASDPEFMRRVYLDLLGRIPRVSEARAFLKDTNADRRAKLIEDLSGRYDHASHLAAVWRSFLIPETADLEELGGVGEFEAWLTERFRPNLPYDKLVSELLLAEGRANESALLFYAALKLKPEEIARQTSRAFLGIRLECAQCHDHKFDDRWKQRDFWGYAAFFAQISGPEGKLNRVSPVMRVRDNDNGEVMIPDTTEVVPPMYPQEHQPAKLAQNVSRRQMLAAWLTSADNPHFARATVNRVWSQMFGRGIVNPVDDMREANPPLCPEVLDELAEYFIRSHYDLRRLYVTLALTDAYQLASSGDADGAGRRDHFAQMNAKCFTAEQLYDCIAVATRVDTGGMQIPDGALVDLSRLNNSSRAAFLEQFRASADNVTEYQGGITQALTLMNGSLTNSATQLQTSGLLRSLQAPFFTDEQRVETLFLATLSRPPSENEKAAVVAALGGAKTDNERAQALGDALWALLNSAEFTLIH